MKYIHQWPVLVLWTWWHPNLTREFYTFPQFPVSFFKICFIDYATTVVPFPPFIPLYPEYPLHSHSSPLVHVRGSYIYKFFSFYISYTILNLPPSIFYLPFMLLILCTFPPLSPSHSPIDNPPCDLHFCGSVPVLVVCLVCFCFCFRCGY